MGRQLVTRVKITILCIASVVVATAGASRLWMRAWGYAGNVRAVRTAGPHDVADTAVLDPRLYATTAIGESVSFEVVPDGARILVAVVAAACDPCWKTVDELVAVLNELEDTRVRVVVVTDQTGDDLRAAVSRLAATGNPLEVRLIADSERFRAATGIVGVPTVMLIESGRVRAVMLGTLNRPGADRLQHMLDIRYVHDREGMAVEYGGEARAILLDASLGELEVTGEGDQRTEIEP